MGVSMREGVPVDCRKISQNFLQQVHVTFCGGGEHRVGSQMTEVSEAVRRLPTTRLFELVVSCLASVP